MDVDAVRTALTVARESWDETGETVLDSGRSYLPGEPVFAELVDLE